MEHLDAVLTPTTPSRAIPVHEVDERRLPLSRFTRAVNYLGLCALAVPSGLGRDGLPHSVQFVGKPDSEARLLEIGLTFEQLRGDFPSPDISGFNRKPEPGRE